jgi:Flp pilus assembly pilin Flp
MGERTRRKAMSFGVWGRIHASAGSFAGSGLEEEGQTFVEYGMLIAVIAVVVVLAALVFGSSVSSLFSGIVTNL